MQQGIMMVCSPCPDALAVANADPEKFLYQCVVDPRVACAQHKGLQDVLADLSVRVVDVASLLPDDMPMEARANIVFVRDPLIVTPRGIVLGRMREHVREAEVKAYKYILHKLGKNVVFEIRTPGVLEGGDYIPSDGQETFIGVGMRTNWDAVQQLMERDLFGTKRVVVVYSPREDHDMHRIHLDCYFGIVGEKRCVVWEGAVAPGAKTERHVDVYENGQKVLSSVRLHDYLVDNGYHVTTLSDRSHYHYGCNVVLLPGGYVLTQDDESSENVERATHVAFSEIHKMYGGIHCATQYLP